MSDRQLADWRNHALTLENEVNKVVVGQTGPVRLITTAIFARGHVLLEGDVGVGKTTLLRACRTIWSITPIWAKMANRT
jgi:MoxR-like ATPase